MRLGAASSTGNFGEGAPNEGALLIAIGKEEVYQTTRLRTLQSWIQTLINICDSFEEMDQWGTEELVLAQREVRNILKELLDDRIPELFSTKLPSIEDIEIWNPANNLVRELREVAIGQREALDSISLFRTSLNLINAESASIDTAVTLIDRAQLQKLVWSLRKKLLIFLGITYQILQESPLTSRARGRFNIPNVDHSSLNFSREDIDREIEVFKNALEILKQLKLAVSSNKRQGQRIIDIATELERTQLLRADEIDTIRNILDIDEVNVSFILRELPSNLKQRFIFQFCSEEQNARIEKIFTEYMASLSK